MIKVEQTHNFELIKQILMTPVLFDEIQDDGSCLPEEFEPNPEWLYLLAKHDETILGLILLHDINSICVQGHINILPKYWGKRYDEIVIKGLQWLRENTKALKVIATVPEDCTHVLEATKRWGFKQEGFSPNSIKRKNKLQGRYLLGIEL